MKRLVLKLRELPKLIEVVGERGERVWYWMMPAGRKFGASLQKVPAGVQRSVARERRE